jgi:hypothetical protein
MQQNGGRQPGVGKSKKERRHGGIIVKLGGGKISGFMLGN